MPIELYDLYSSTYCTEREGAGPERTDRLSSDNSFGGKENLTAKRAGL
jgi:hypothetical protein